MRTIALVIALASGTARADFVVATGVRWNPMNYTMPISTTGPMGTNIGPSTTPLSGFNWTNLNGYFGMFFLEGRLGFQLSLDVAYSSRHDVPPPAMTQDLSFTDVGFAIGGKYYIKKPDAGHVAPYVYFDFYKYFALVSTSATTPKDYQGFVQGLASPLGIDVAIGAEYFFTNAFSLGAEVLGLRYGYTYGEFTPPGITMNTVSETNHYLSFYTGLTLNYRFDVKIAKRAPAAEEEEEEAPKPKKKKKREEQNEPAPSEPPPAAESVD
jgi:hypothetical protein